jgi:hypothetical protein
LAIRVVYTSERTTSKVAVLVAGDVEQGGGC